jgi:ABC-type uncharacterized transport system ATPase subunit
MTTVLFYTRRACPLCEEAFAVTTPIATDLGARVEVIDIDLELGLLNRYNDRVPVVEFEGEVLAEGPIDSPRQFRKKLKRALAG